MIFQIRNKILCILVSLAVLAGAAAGLPGLSINSDTRVFFSNSNEHRQALAAFEARYARKTTLLIALHADDGDIFTRERLNVVRDLTDESWLLPYATRVESIVNFSDISSDEYGVIIEEMVPQGTLQNVATIRERVLTDSLLLNKLISRDGKTTVVSVTVDYPMASSAAVAEIQEKAKDMVGKLVPESAGLDVWYGGRVASSLAFSSAAKNDLSTLMAASYLLIFVLLILILRKFVLAIALFSSSVFATVAALGVAGWFGLQLNAATANTPTVILGLCVATLVHFVTSTIQGVRRGEDRSTAISNAFRHDLFPISLTFATTTIGFLTLNWADAPPFRELGNIVAAGCLFGWFFGVFWLPAILGFARVDQGKTGSRLAELVDLIGSGVIRHKKKLLAGSTCLAVIFISGLSLIEIDDNYVRFFDHRFEYRHHADSIQSTVVGLDVIEFDISSGKEDGVFEPEYLQKVQDFERWAMTQPKVDYCASIAEIFRRIHQHMNGGDKSWRFLPEEREMLAQYLLLYEMSLPYGQSLNDTVTINRDRTRVTVIMRGASTKEVRAFKERADDWLASRDPVMMAGTGTGLAVMYAYLSYLNIEDMTGGTFMALAIISLILILAFRSLRYGSLSLIPNLLPAAVGLGVWGFLVGEAGVAVSAVGAVTLGIIVDDTIHMVWRYAEARRQGKTAEDSVRHMFAIVGEPMLITTVVLTLAFASLALSGFHITAALGTLSAAVIGFALLFDWLLFVPLLLVLDSRTDGKFWQRSSPGKD